MPTLISFVFTKPSVNTTESQIYNFLHQTSSSGEKNKSKDQISSGGIQKKTTISKQNKEVARTSNIGRSIKVALSESMLTFLSDPIIIELLKESTVKKMCE